MRRWNRFHPFTSHKIYVDVNKSVFSEFWLVDRKPLETSDIPWHRYTWKKSLMQISSETPRFDKRENCFWLETSLGPNEKHYLSFDAPSHLEVFEQAFYKCLYNSVTAMQVLSLMFGPYMKERTPQKRTWTNHLWQGQLSWRKSKLIFRWERCASLK